MALFGVSLPFIQLQRFLNIKTISTQQTTYSQYKSLVSPLDQRHIFCLGPFLWCQVWRLAECLRIPLGWWSCRWQPGSAEKFVAWWRLMRLDRKLLSWWKTPKKWPVRNNTVKRFRPKWEIQSSFSASNGHFIKFSVTVVFICPRNISSRQASK